MGVNASMSSLQIFGLFTARLLLSRKEWESKRINIETVFIDRGRVC